MSHINFTIIQVDIKSTTPQSHSELSAPILAIHRPMSDSQLFVRKVHIIFYVKAVPNQSTQYVGPSQPAPNVSTGPSQPGQYSSVGLSSPAHASSPLLL